MASSNPVDRGLLDANHEQSTPARSGASAFVGRERELQHITGALENAVQGDGRVVLVSGEAGIGKTRLLSELAARAGQRGALVLWGTCAEDETGRAYGPFREALEGYVRDVGAALLQEILGANAGVIARLVPLVRRLPDVAEPVALQPDEERTRLFDAVSQFLIALSKHRPLLLVLDDLHWAKPDAAALLHHVARTAARQRMLVVGAYRSAEVDDEGAFAATLAVLRRLPYFESLRLAGLKLEEVEALLAALAGPTAVAPHAERVDAALVAALLEHTRGNPFFVRSVLQHLIEEGTLRLGEAGWQTVRPLEEIGIPEGVRQVVGRRLKRCTEGARQFLTAGSAMGQSFRFAVAAAVAELSEEQALAAVDETLGAQLIEAGASLDTYRFGHALVRQTLYESLNPSRQVRLHRRIAEGMERVYGERASEHAAEIAHHYHRSASLPGAERGVAPALMAAERAETAYAHNDGATFLRAALELLPQSDGRRPRLLGRLGLALSWALRFDEALQVAGEAGDLIAGADGDGAAADYLAEVAMALYGAGFPRGAWALASQGLRYVGERRDLTWVKLMVHDIIRREAEDPSNPGIIIDTPERRLVAAVVERLALSRDELFLLGGHGFVARRSRQDILQRFADNPYWLMAGAGEYRGCLRIWEERIAQYECEGRIADAVECLAHLARCHNALGGLAAAGIALDRGVALAERLTGLSQRSQPLAMTRFEIRTVLDEGWNDFVREVAEQPPMAPESYWLFAAIRAQAGCFCARTGQTDQALFFLQSILEPLDRAPGWAITYELIPFSAAATLWLLRRTDHIEAIERNLREKILAPDFRYPMVDARLSLAHLCALQGRDDEAVEWFAAARTVLDEQGARPLRAIVDFDEALMYHRRAAAGDSERIGPLLESALVQFRAIGMPGWIRRAEAMRDGAGLEARNRSRVAGADQPTAAVPARGQPDPMPANLAETKSQEPFSAQHGPETSVFRRDGDFWTIEYDGRVARLKDTKGLQYLAHLLRHPGRELLAVDLATGIPGNGSAAGEQNAISNEAPAAAMPDAQARLAYKERFAELRDDLVEAERNNDLGRAARAREEMELITEQLAVTSGLGGRRRVGGEAAERARQTVTKGIKAAIQKIRQSNPALARHLARAVTTGYYCAYSPDPERIVAWML